MRQCRFNEGCVSFRPAAAGLMKVLSLRLEGAPFWTPSSSALQPSPLLPCSRAVLGGDRPARASRHPSPRWGGGSWWGSPRLGKQPLGALRCCGPTAGLYLVAEMGAPRPGEWGGGRRGRTHLGKRPPHPLLSAAAGDAGAEQA